MPITISKGQFITEKEKRLIMGLAASQVNFLGLTERKADIGRELQHLSLEKNALTRDMQLVTLNYQNALSSKTLKWSNNNGITYVDINYGTLMRPGAANGNKPILLSDSCGRIVVDEKYKKYAEMISSDGSSGGNWSGETRSRIIEQLTGVSESQVNEAASKSDITNEKRLAMEDAKAARDAIDTKSYTDEEFINKYLKASSLGLDSEIKTANADSNAMKITDAIIGKGYFSSSVEEKFQEAMNNAAKSIMPEDSYSSDAFVELAIGALKTALGNAITINMRVDSEGNGTQAAYEAADAVYQAALAEFNEANGNSASMLTAAQETQIAFYDQLFSAIAELGWTFDNGVENSDYLSQMMQNNSYYITTVTKNSSYDATLPEDNRNFEYSFDTDIASNYSNIFIVNDTDARNEALATYEYEKSIINNKESKIDTRMKDLETEQSAIQKMLESIEQVKGDNIERTFNLWG